jgi:hypothetical protein
VTDRVLVARQMIVAEVGEAGQARLEEATVPLAGEGLAHEIACAYAARSGVGAIVPGPLDETALAPAFLECRAARSVVAGSRAALAALRAVLLPADTSRP